MSDPVERAAAIDKFEPWLKVKGYSEGELNMLKAVLYELRFLPSAEPECNLDEWCHDCKEYDKEKNRCPRWNRVIRTALEEAQPERSKGEWVGVHAYCDHMNEEAKVKGKTERYLPTGIVVGVYCNQCWCRAEQRSNFCPNCGAKMEQEGKGCRLN